MPPSTTQARSGHVITCWTGQIYARRRDVFALSPPLRREALEQYLIEDLVVVDSLGHPALRITRRDAIDIDAMTAIHQRLSRQDKSGTNGAHSLLMPLVMFRTAPLLAAYATFSELPWKAEMLAKLMILRLKPGFGADWIQYLLNSLATTMLAVVFKRMIRSVAEMGKSIVGPTE